MAVGISRGASSSFSSGLTVFKCRCGGIWPCCKTRMALIRPAIPAALSKWPMLVFTEPTTSGRSATAAGAEHGAEGLDLDRVAQPRAGAVGFDVTDVGGGQAGVGQRGAEHGLLRRAVGSGQPVAAPVVVHRAAANHGQDAIAVGHRVGKPLEHDHAAPFAANVSVGRGVERLAAAVGGHHVGLGQGQRHLGAEDQIHAAGQRHVRFAPPQALAGQVHRNQRRRAGRVQRQARPVEIEEIRQSIGQNRMTAAGARKDVHVAEVFRLHQGVVAADDADVDARPGLREPAGGQAAVFQGFPGDLQQEAMLRVDAHGLARRDAEELGVELVDLGEKPSPARVHLARRRGVRIVVVVDVPAVGGHLADGVAAVAQQPPEGSRVVGAAGKPAAHPHHGDRLERRVLGRRQLGLRLLEQVNRILQRSEIPPRGAR